MITLFRPLGGLISMVFTMENKTNAKGDYIYGAYERIIPIFESLGLKGVISSEEFTARYTQAKENDKENGASDTTFSALLTPIVNLVEDLLKHPLNTILDLLPRAARAISSGSLNDQVHALLDEMSSLVSGMLGDLNIDLTADGINAMIAGQTISFDIGDFATATITLKAIDWAKLAGCGSLKAVISASAANAYRLDIQNGRPETYITVSKYLLKAVFSTKIEGIIAQQRQWNREKNIRTAESKEKMLGRMKAELEAPEAELESLRFAFLPRMVSGNDVILASGLQKSFDEKKLFAGVELHIRRGDRAFLLGPNGCGKTTLLRVLLGKTPADGGRFTFGTNVQIGYFDQGLGGLHPEKTVLAEIWDTYPAMTQTEVRSALAAFLFQGDDVYQLVRDLSGGEKARTALLKLMLSGANLLLLDEPTNHLDISSREALEDALAGYEGTMLIVSHDRYFINKIANRVLHLTHDGVKEYLGGYDDYVQALEEQPPTPKAAQEKPKQNAYKLRKERESERRKLTGRIARCEEKIARMDEEITTLNAQLERPEIAADYAKVLELTQQLASLHEEQERLYAQWEQLQEQLEADDNA